MTSLESGYTLSESSPSGTIYVLHTRLWKTWVKGTYPQWDRFVRDPSTDEIQAVLTASLPNMVCLQTLFVIPFVLSLIALCMVRDVAHLKGLIMPIFLIFTGIYFSEITLEKIYQRDVYPRVQEIAAKHGHQLVIQTDEKVLKMHCGFPDYFTEAHLVLRETNGV